MNRFELARYLVVEDPPDERSFAATELAVPIIDGVPLFEVVGNGFPGVPVGLVVSPARHWLDEPDRYTWMTPTADPRSWMDRAASPSVAA